MRPPWALCKHANICSAYRPWINQIPSFSNTLNIDICLTNGAWLSLECKRKVTNIVHQLQTSREGPESFSDLSTALFTLIVYVGTLLFSFMKKGLVRLNRHIFSYRETIRVWNNTQVNNNVVFYGARTIWESPINVLINFDQLFRASFNKAYRAYIGCVPAK